jgi:hypothetical protein
MYGDASASSPSTRAQNQPCNSQRNYRPYVDGVARQLDAQIPPEGVPGDDNVTYALDCPHCGHGMAVPVVWMYPDGGGGAGGDSGVDATIAAFGVNTVLRGAQQDSTWIFAQCNCGQDHACDPAHPGCGQEHYFRFRVSRGRDRVDTFGPDTSGFEEVLSSALLGESADRPTLP